METRRLQIKTSFRALLLLALIGISAFVREPEPDVAEPVFNNGYFAGIGDDRSFDAYFSEGGELFIYSDLGDYKGRWSLAGQNLCVEFEIGPRAGRHCEPVTRVEPMSVEIGDHLFLARMARALRIS